MNNTKIYVCTTFREFTNNDNDVIQRMFLHSLENQTYKNIELVVTLFGEKKVEEEIKRFSFNSKFFNGDANGFRYSLTQVLLNTVEYTKSIKDDYIILWTTCDVIYDNNFFEIIIENNKKSMIGTSHPHTIYPSIKAYSNKVGNKKGKLFSGFDLIYFDNSFLKKTSILQSLQSYAFNDWGVFEHFLISLNEFHEKCNMINIYEEVKIYKIENDRVLTNEPNQFLVNSHKLNSEVFSKFLFDKSLTRKYFDLAFCHIKFSLTKNKIRHHSLFIIDLLLYFKRRFKKNFVRMIPNIIKKKMQRS